MRELLNKDNRSYLMGVSILWIIGLHYYMYSALPVDSILGFLFSKGYIGVDVFLFLSAYGLCFSYNANSLGTFYKRRIERIFPIYLLFVVVAVLIYGNTYSESPLALILYQCSGIASFRHTDFEWYVPALIVIYASFPLFYKLVNWLYTKNRSLLMPLTLLLSLVSPLTSEILFPMLASRLSIIVVGIATYLLLKDDDSVFMFRLYALCALFAILFRQGNEPDWSLMVPGVLGLLSMGHAYFPLKKVFGFLGKHSLELYLAQSFALNQFFLKTDMTFIPKLLVSMVMIVIGTCFLFLFQEASMRLWKKNAR